MFNTHHSGIESLSVELWREIFDYFDVNDLWYLFRGLNKQIDGIIDQNDVDIRSLKLRKENKIKHFFSKYSLNSLVQLQLLSLDRMYSFNDNLFTFWNQLLSLKCLRSLKVIFGTKSHPNTDLKEKEFLIHSIFNQDFCPLLTCFIVRNNGNDSLNTELPISSLIQTTKPTNIKYLSIDNLTFIDMIKLLPALQNTNSCCIDDELSCNNEFHSQQPMTIGMPMMRECKKLDLSLSDNITFEYIEYILKHTPNLKKLTLCIGCHLLDVKKWELLLSVRCSRLLAFELTCNGDDNDNNYAEAGRRFEEECAATTFWKERNAIVIFESYAEDDFYYTTAKFNIGKTKDEMYYWPFTDEMDTTDDP